jgi:dTDP-4-amino-4,6-dideoxygalactose transaminase
VLVSDFTFPASGNAIVQTGAVPVMVDCLPGRFDLDFDDARAKVTGRTRAIMVVHPFGQPVAAEEIARFADETGLWVLEDAACAITSNSSGRRCGALGDAAAFSFHPRKILTTGEGGMITTNDDALYERLNVLRTHGSQPSTGGLTFVENGFNYRMTEIQAALGLAQLKRIDAIVDERRRVAKIYLDKLTTVNIASVPLSGNAQECSFQSFVIMLADDVEREQVIEKLKVAGIETTLGTYAMHAHPAFKQFGYAPHDLSNSHAAERQSLTLPLIKGMTEDDVSFITGALGSAVANT